MIALDQTVFFQIVFFLFLWFVLNKLLFRPFLRLLEERERRTEGLKREAAALMDEGARLRADYEESIKRARDEGYAAKEALVQEARQVREQTLARAREETARMLAQVREEIRREMHRERELSAREAEAIAQELAGKILGRKVG